MKKNDLEIEKSFIDYLVKTIKDENLSSLEVTRTLADKHRLKIKINTVALNAALMALDKHDFLEESRYETAAGHQQYEHAVTAWPAAGRRIPASWYHLVRWFLAPPLHILPS